MKSTKRRGLFYCIEGIDGAGKSTVAELVSKTLSAKGHNIVFVDKKDIDHIPSAGVRRQLKHIRHALWDYPAELNLDEMGDYHWLALIASWYAALEQSYIEHLLEEGKDVIIDGWVYKYLARFSLKNSLSKDVAHAVLGGVRSPDRVILLDIDPSVAGKRKGKLKDSESGRYDGGTGDALSAFVTYQSKVQSILAELALTNHWQVIDSNELSLDDLTARIVQAVELNYKG